MNASDGLSQFFQDVILVLGGVFAAHPPDNAAVVHIARGLERAYLRARRESAEVPRKAAAPHPALARLLRVARGGRRGQR